MKFKDASSNPRVTSSNVQVRVQIKQVNSLKSSSFPKIICPKLFGNSQGNSVSVDNLLFYVSANPWLWLQKEAEWVNITFERRDPNSHGKVTLPLMILEKFAFSFAPNLRKQNVTDFSFISFIQNFVLCL